MWECRRDLQMLNERRIFLTLLHLFLAFAATMEHVVKGRSRVEFDADSSVSCVVLSEGRAQLIVSWCL